MLITTSKYHFQNKRKNTFLVKFPSHRIKCLFFRFLRTQSTCVPQHREKQKILLAAPKALNVPVGVYVLVVVDVAVDVVAVSRATNATGAVTTAIVSSSISTFSSKAGAASDWHGSSSNETVNYLSYSRHAGFAVPWKTHITCSIRTEPPIDFYHAIYRVTCPSKLIIFLDNTSEMIFS